MSKILIVEDEKPIREFIAINLKRENMKLLRQFREKKHCHC